MKRKNIALIAGGDSGEFEISIKSAKMISENIDPELFNVFTILICKNKWVFLSESGVEQPVDKNDFSIMLSDKRVVFDCAFITIHGTPGEDGKLQGYFDLLGIPYTTSGLLASALTFNKHYCNLVVSRLGVPVAPSIRLTETSGQTVGDILKHVSLPVFVKPNRGGSSLGTSFVRDLTVLEPAISLAFEHDDEVLVEEYLKGVELTCGVFRQTGRVKVLPVTEIISKTDADFFDFKAKYTPGAADEITPARIPESLTEEVKKLTARLYDQLDMSGLARFDFIYSQDILYFLEVNVTPGMSETSIVPQQAAIEGISSTQLFTILINEALSR